MKVAIYARVSSEAQSEQQTIQSQLAALRTYAQKNSYTVVNEFLDDGFSGELLARPGLDKLRDELRKKTFDSVLIYSPDRLSRELIYQGVVLNEFKAASIKPIFLSMPSVDDTPFGRLQLNMLGAFAEFEKALILERTRRGRLHKARRGTIVGGRSPYGYHYILGDSKKRVDGRYELNSHEVRIVKLIFKLLTEAHLSVRGIAKELTKRGIPPRQGREWRTSSLHKILRCDTYATAITYYNKLQNVEPAAHQGNGPTKYRRSLRTARKLRAKEDWIPIQLPENFRIISQETFAKAQRLLQLNGQICPRTPRFYYLLKGLVCCSTCKAPFQGIPYHDVTYYRCGNRHRTFPKPAKCEVGSVRASKLDDVVWDAIVRALNDPKLILEHTNKLTEDAKRHSKSHHNVDGFESALRKVMTQKDRLLDAYRTEAITVDQLKTQMAKLEIEEVGLQQELAQAQSAKSGSKPAFLKQSVEENCQHIAHRLKEIGHNPEERRRLLVDLVERITLDLSGKVVRIQGALPTRSETDSCMVSPSAEDDARPQQRS